uniref:muscarinic acetylcholine receptor M1-like n=1 Tax=Myxine glutinosa TaxID=7769 RepID=UPI00358EB446
MEVSSNPCGENSTVQQCNENSSSLSQELTVAQAVAVGTVTGVISLLTIVGNVLVLVAFKVNRQLKTVNNYFLLSLAVADIIIGIVSMNLFTTYIIMGRWPLGSVACDLWLAVDYVASNASVMNLLVISMDRYLSVTRPLRYKAKRTPRRAAIMIGTAWVVSLILWGPAIMCWQYIVGTRTVKEGECYIQFLSEPIITFGTAIAAFYLPVSIMTVLYWRIYCETQKRTRELVGLQGSEIESSRRFLTPKPARNGRQPDAEHGGDKRPPGRCGCFKDMLAARTALRECSRSSTLDGQEEAPSPSPSLYSEEDDEIPPDRPRAIYSIVLAFPGHRPVLRSPETSITDDEVRMQRNAPSEPSADRMHRQNTKDNNGTSISLTGGRERTSSGGGGTGTPSPFSGVLSVKEAMAAKRCAQRVRSQANKRKRITLIKEKKAAKTLSAILLSFIITWTPYNIMVLVSPFCNGCVPDKLWTLGYWLCYVNSTVNPVCYALCNKNFRKTFKWLLLCQWDQWKSQGYHFPNRNSVVQNKGTGMKMKT